MSSRLWSLMGARLRKITLDVKGSYWFLPAVFSSLAVGLAVLTIWLDLRGAGWWLAGTGWLEASSAEGARSQVTVIASAMIAIASTVFAITIAAVAYASGNYGPRLLANFMNDRGNQVSLGVFIATFVYALLVLRVVQGGESGGAEPFIPQLSLFVATLLVLFAVAVLVFFLHHIPASIRINTVIAGIGRSLLVDIETRFPDRAEEKLSVPPPRGVPVFPSTSGYVEIVSFGRLDQLAEEKGAVIILSVRPGDFVHPAIALAEISGVEADESLRKAVCGAFAIGSERTRAQDIDYLLDELVEIALRALSPGINDPFTAVSSLHWMGSALASLAGRKLNRGPEQGNYDPGRVRAIADDFGHYLRRGFGALRHSAATSPIAAAQYLEALYGVAAVAKGARREAIIDESRRLVDQAGHCLTGPALADLKANLARFDERVGDLS